MADSPANDSPATPATFVHLHVHSHYSLLNALPTPKELVYAAKADNQPALALTDNGALYGAIDFYKACTKEKIKPIIGIDAYLAPRTRFDKESQIDKPRSRLVLLAKNFTGYQNLIKLVTLSNTEGFYYKPRLDNELLATYAEGLIAIIPSFAGEIAQALKHGDMKHASERLDFYKGVFGSDCYLELTHHPEIMDHAQNQARIVQIARASSTPLVAAHDVYYLKPEDRLARETMIKIQNGGVVDLGADHDSDENFSFINQAQAAELFSDTPDALANTIRIAEACNVEIEIGTHWYFPNYIIESGREPDDELQVTAYEGVAWRGMSLADEETKTRLDYELEVIKNKGYAKYFLVVGDLLREARERGILTTIRGSVAGSLTTYVLGITNVDPLEYKLPFERFLNPERPSAPDIDMDFADDRRDEIIEYAKTKYGADKVAQIGTFGTMMARAAVRDVARALGHPYSTGDRIAKLIPLGAQGFPMTIKRALEMEPDLAELYKKDSESREVIDLAKQIEGRVRHLGVHAAGVVIAPEPLNQFVPIQLDPKTGKFITQYEMKSVGEDGVGLLKFDFLGIKNLAILADAVKRVKKIRNVVVDIENIPLSDPKTFAILAAGQTMGLFQLNGSGMTAFLKQLKPSSIHDINAMVALYRPGPMESIPQYIERKHNPSLVSYLDPRLETILDRSYGVITYQDDVMTIARELAGYSWLEADTLRKAMGKKIPEVMAAEKDKLLKGFVEFGNLAPNLGDKLWTLIEPFASYGFNKCLTADTRILDADSGVPTAISDLLLRKKNSLVVYSLTDRGKITHKSATRPFSNGQKPVFTLTTRSGRVIRATANHPFLTWSGWTNLSDLKIGDRLATPRSIPPPRRPTTLSLAHAATLGYLIAEGNLCHPHGVYFYSKNPEEVTAFLAHAASFSGTTFTVDTKKPTTAVYVGGGKNNELWKLLKNANLLNCTATEKFVPEVIWKTDTKAVAVFLATLWQGDGAISIANEQIFYATSSRRLADDVQLLLLRFCILSTIHTKKFRYRGGHKVGYTVAVTGRENLEYFLRHIGLHVLSKKQIDLRTVVKNSTLRTNNTGRGTTDTLPAPIIDLVREEMVRQNITVSKMVTTCALAERLFFKNQGKRGYPRDTIMTMATVLNSTTLNKHATSDIFWDEIKTIEPSGTEETFDITVPDGHNFVANSIIVHNSHAASYGRVAYQTAYMKANFPVEYMSAVLTADSGDTDKISEIIHECERMDIVVLPPDINESFTDFSVVPGTPTIRFGLTTIKNFGAGIAETIITERKANGAFKSLADFLSRIFDRNLNKKSLEALITTGALDRFAERGTMYVNMDTLLAFNRDTVARRDSAQSSLFGGMESSVDSLVLNEVPPASTSQKLQWEKDLLGVYVSGHPLNAFKDEIAKRPSIGTIVADKRAGIPVVTCGMIASVRELLTKKGDRMAFVQLADQTDTIEMVLFPRTYTEFKELVTVGNCVAVKGRLSLRNDEVSIAAERVKALALNEEDIMT